MNMFSPNMTGWGLQSDWLVRRELVTVGGPFEPSVLEELFSRLAADWRDGRDMNCVGKEDGPELSIDWAIIELADDEAPSTEGIFLEATSFS